MGVLSGYGGTVDGVGSMRNWSVSHTADLQKAVASSTKGMNVKVEGNKDWSGSYSAYGHTPLKMPGDSFLFKGSIEGTKGATGNVIVNQVQIVMDIAGAKPIEHTVNFGGNGALSLGASAATDVSTPTIYPSAGRKVEIVDVDGIEYAEIPNINTVTLTITADNQAYVDSSCAQNTKRTPGNLDANISIAVNTDYFDGLPAVNVWKFLKMYVTADTFWLLEAILFGEASDLTVDRETAAIVGATLNAEFSGYYPLAGETTEGKIVMPNGSDFWPPT